MLFARRSKPRFWEKIRVALWPRRSWGRSVRYIKKRVLRMSGSPHAVAAGFASGVFASCTPLVGFHFILGAFVAYVLRGNLVASAFGTAIGNPLTFPFIWAGTYRVGSWILGLEGEHMPAKLSGGLFSESLETMWPLLKPMLVAGIPIGAIAWVLFYFPVRRAVRIYQEKRKRRVLDRRHERAMLAKAGTMGGEA